MTVERVFVIRHGETDWNAQKRWQGHTPTGLNATGLTQAQALGQYLGQRPISAVYTSDLPRALQTASALTDVLGLQPQVDIRWREIHAGIFQGLSGDEARQRYPDELALWYAHDLEYIIPEGESRNQLGMRALAAWEDAVSLSPTGEVAVVTHGGTIWNLLRVLFGTGWEQGRTRVANTSITTLENAGGTWKLAAFAETPHLNGHR